MPIDLQNEELLSLTDATRALPPIDGRRPHTSTLWRWCRRGIRGVHLEHVRLGHRVCTTREALERFVQRLAEVDLLDRAAPVAPTKTTRSDAQRQRDVERADHELSRAGI